MKLPLSKAVALINKARDEAQREKVYRLWLVRYPNYTEKNFETFEEFYENNQIKFDYKLKEGRCHTTNARYLLQMAGILTDSNSINE
mgnify:CR=1 FL=1